MYAWWLGVGLNGELRFVLIKLWQNQIFKWNSIILKQIRKLFELGIMFSLLSLSHDFFPCTWTLLTSHHLTSPPCASYLHPTTHLPPSSLYLLLPLFPASNSNNIASSSIIVPAPLHHQKTFLQLLFFLFSSNKPAPAALLSLMPASTSNPSSSLLAKQPD